MLLFKSFHSLFLEGDSVTLEVIRDELCRNLKIIKIANIFYAPFSPFALCTLMFLLEVGS